MESNFLKGGAIALALLSAMPAVAADDAALEQLRSELKQLREQYEARIRALEQRLEQAQRGGEAAATPAAGAGVAGNDAVAAQGAVAGSAARAPASASATASGVTAETADRTPGAMASGAPMRGLRAGRASSANVFNPEISLILSGTYARLSRDPETWTMTGFALPADAELGPGERGPSLGETELAISGNIDPYLRGVLRVALEPDNSVAIEEANIQTTQLARGWSVKAGRFFSGIGYLNEQHPHYWDFVDAPLAYQAFLGRQYGDDGVQVRWLAPTDTYLEIGAEIGRGRSFPAARGDGNGAGAYALHAHTGGDVGVSHSWRAGLSVLRANAHDLRTTLADPVAGDLVNAFSGHTTVWIADLVWKWAPDGNPARRNFKLQAEWMRRSQSGELTADADGAALTDAFRSRQSGWYVQGVWQFMPRWRVGLRADRMDGGSVDYGSNPGGLSVPGYDPKRTSLMVDYSPTEFSRFRVQLARDESRQGQPDNQLFLQYQTSLGAHGAHRF